MDKENIPNSSKVQKSWEDSLDSIPPPSPSVEIQIMSEKVGLRCEGKTLLGVVNKLLKTKSLLTMPSNVLPLHLKQTFPLIIWIFTKGEGDEIESRLPFKIFSTVTMSKLMASTIETDEISYECFPFLNNSTQCTN